jgi:hypothetical protein
LELTVDISVRPSLTVFLEFARGYKGKVKLESEVLAKTASKRLGICRWVQVLARSTCPILFPGANRLKKYYHKLLEGKL